MSKSFRLNVVLALSLLLQTCCMIGKAQADEPKPIFELDCINFAGRFLANAPLKKKAHPGLAVDGTSWAVAPRTNLVSIIKVFPGEAGEKAGLETGDEIVSVNGYSTSGLNVSELFSAYHMYDPRTMTETLVVQKKDGTKKTVKLDLLTLDKCNADEKCAWLDIYKCLGY